MRPKNLLWSRVFNKCPKISTHFIAKIFLNGEAFLFELNILNNSNGYF